MSQVSIQQVFVRLQPADDDRDHAVVAEPVEQPQLQSESVRIGHHRDHVLVRVAAGGQVELVGFVDELHDALQSDPVEPLP